MSRSLAYFLWIIDRATRELLWRWLMLSLGVSSYITPLFRVLRFAPFGPTEATPTRLMVGMLAWALKSWFEDRAEQSWWLLCLYCMWLDCGSLTPLLTFIMSCRWLWNAWVSSRSTVAGPSRLTLLSWSVSLPTERISYSVDYFSPWLFMFLTVSDRMSAPVAWSFNLFVTGGSFLKENWELPSFRTCR